MKNQTRRQQAENRAGWLFMAPAMVVFLTMVVLAVIMSLALSFSEWNFLSGMSGIKWVGFKNFVRIFADRKFKMAMTNTMVYAITVAPVSIALALLFAFLLNDKVYLRKFNRMCLFVPYISSMVALTAVFRFLFRSDGPVNMILINVFHMSEVPKWLTSSSLCKIPVICVMVYAGIGFSLIVYMAALQNVPGELYEAARVDGANGFRQFFKITIPLISPTTFYLCIVRLIAAFKAFTVINIMGMSGNAPSMVTEIYGNAFNSYKFGYASAEAWILVGVILIITLVQFKVQKRWVYY
ncbi:ABC transporter permease subunit [Clostridium sp. MCC353]|uniref:carbohydrate ABC transporter permease n=1 Tax=Clostridium sp. MCC353 TaxID=2592646 RepID=UPI001C02B823|nr:sugar ABC transporter permease [Clostridium sp. MCC353]MBT9775078.1 ABC transporter permease subunit [Clostridium sp. MCC353]